MDTSPQDITSPQECHPRSSERDRSLAVPLFSPLAWYHVWERLLSTNWMVLAICSLPGGQISSSHLDIRKRRSPFCPPLPGQLYFLCQHDTAHIHFLSGIFSPHLLPTVVTWSLCPTQGNHSSQQHISQGGLSLMLNSNKCCGNNNPD